MEEEKYRQGFNSGYVLAKYKPELFDSIRKKLEPSNDYLDGMLSGGKQYGKELRKNQSKDKPKDKEPSKNRGKDR